MSHITKTIAWYYVVHCRCSVVVVVTVCTIIVLRNSVITCLSFEFLIL